MKKKLTITLPDGKEKEDTILVSFESVNTDKKYIVYSDLSPKNKEIEIYSGYYEDGEVLPIDTEPEKELANTIIDTIFYGAQEKYKIVEE